MRHKVSSSEGKYRCQELNCPLWRPLVHLKVSNNGRKSRCWKLARQPWELPLCPNFRSKLGADKCTFAAKEVNYLGHRVIEEGLLPDSSLLAAIWEIPPPRTATEVRSFLGLTSYYRCYVKNFATNAGPLHALTRKDAVFHWDEECQAAFDRLKTLLTTNPITAFSDFSQAFRP